jgi:hypothetical protein
VIPPGPLQEVMVDRISNAIKATSVMSTLVPVKQEPILDVLPKMQNNDIELRFGSRAARKSAPSTTGRWKEPEEPRQNKKRKLEQSPKGAEIGSDEAALFGNPSECSSDE